MNRAADIKIKALAPWFGSKRNLAPRIIAELGDHRAYWEPFCGSMAVLLSKPPASMETVNDLNGDLINLARVVQSDTLSVQLFERLSRTLMHESVFQEAAERWAARGYAGTIDAPSVDQAVDYFVCSWLGRNGVAGTESYNQGFCVRYTKNGGHGATRFISSIDSIPDWFHRLRAVTILQRDGIELCYRIEDAPGVVIYADPPYLEKGAKYIHDFEDGFMGDDDHARLARSLSRFKRTRVVVSYYEHPRLADLYPGWTKVDCSTTKALASQSSRDGANDTKAPEVLLINGPSFTVGKGGVHAKA